MAGREQDRTSITPAMLMLRLSDMISSDSQQQTVIQTCLFNRQNTLTHPERVYAGQINVEPLEYECE